jgi:hypothetical protein
LESVVVVVVVDEDSVVSPGVTGCTTVVEGGGSTDSVFLYEKQPVEQSNEAPTRLATKYPAVFMI